MKCHLKSNLKNKFWLYFSEKMILSSLFFATTTLEPTKIFTSKTQNMQYFIGCQKENRKIFNFLKRKKIAKYWKNIFSIFEYFCCTMYIRQWAIFRFHVCNMVMMTLDYRISVFRCTFLVCLLPQWFLAMTFANHAQKVWRWPFKKTPSTKLIMHCQKKNIFRADTKKSNVTLREMLVIFMNVSLQHCQSGKSYWLAMTIT